MFCATEGVRMGVNLSYSDVTNLVRVQRLIERVLQAVPADQRDRTARGTPFDSERGRKAVEGRWTRQRNSLAAAAEKLVK